MVTLIANYVNEMPPSVGITNFLGYVQSVSESNPIDEFRQSLRKILEYGTKNRLDKNDFLGGLLLVGLVSNTENYIRSITSEILHLCPIAQTNASDKTANVGAILWHNGDKFARSSFEHSSLAEEKGLKKALDDFAGIKLPSADFDKLLKDYDKICQIRHGLVHADAFLPGKNALKLEIPKFNTSAKIIIRYKHLQEVAATLNSLVTLINRFAFEELCKRWAVEWRKRGDWNASEENILFGKIWDISVCRTELSVRPGKYKITKAQCIGDVRKLYGLT